MTDVEREVVWSFLCSVFWHPRPRIVFLEKKLPGWAVFFEWKWCGALATGDLWLLTGLPHPTMRLSPSNPCYYCKR